MKPQIFIIARVLAITAALAACKHPLEIVGEGDIVDTNKSGHGCTLEQFRAQAAACRENTVNDDYFVNYKAEPRPGWRFVRWDGPCRPDSDFQHCQLRVSRAAVDWWDQTYPNAEIPPSTAVFQRITGRVGVLLAGTPVSGVAYATPTTQGFTGLDGSFQYEEGETVRFTIGATVLGEVLGNDRVTPFDLAGSPVITGADIGWSLRDREDPFQTVVNLAVLLHSLDHDADPTNGIEIRPGVANLLVRLKLAVHQRSKWLAHASNPEGETFCEKQDWQTFLSDPTFRHIVGLANRRELFSSPHRIVKPELAMASLYDSLGIEPHIAGPTQSQAVNPGGESTERFFYNTNGSLTRHEGNLFGGSYETWQYDDNANVIRHEQHSDSYNHHTVETWQYDGHGNLTRNETSGSNALTRANLESTRVYDIDDNQTEWTWARIDERLTTSDSHGYSYDYDRYGRLRRYTQTLDSVNSDGTPFQSAENFNYSHYRDGNLAKIAQTRDAPVVDGVPETSRSLEIDKSCRVTRSESEHSFGGPLVRTWRYDADGRLTQYESGSNVWRFQYEYDTDGNVTRRERVNTSSGAVKQLMTWQYDRAGNVLGREVEYVTTMGFSNDSRSLESWQYHSDGVVKLYTFEATYQLTDLGGSWDVHDIRKYHYDPSGNLTRFEEPGKQVNNWQYNAAGNLTREEIDRGEYGRRVQAWLYDANQNITRHELDEDGDGTIDETETYQYEATGWRLLFSPEVSPFNPYGVSLPPSKPQPDFRESGYVLPI